MDARPDPRVHEHHYRNRCERDPRGGGEAAPAGCLCGCGWVDIGTGMLRAHWCACLPACLRRRAAPTCLARLRWHAGGAKVRGHGWLACRGSARRLAPRRPAPPAAGGRANLRCLPPTCPPSHPP
jgi:hypothetical protein